MSNEETAIAIINTEPITPVRRSILTISEGQVSRIKLLATMMADSQLEYSKMKPGDIFIKMMKGIEVGLEPVASMDLIDVIQGKPTLKPQGMLALAWGSGLMQSLSITDDGKTCTVKMQRAGSPAHVETFSEDNAKSMGLAGKDNWKKQPAVMRKWRAVSAACRIVFPDIIQGMYIPEELSPDTMVNDSGEIIEAQYDDVAAPEVQPSEVNWPSSEKVSFVMGWFRRKGLVESEIFRLAGVTAIDDGDGWRKYADSKDAIKGIQAAFDAELDGKTDQPMPEQSSMFKYMSYVGKTSNLVFCTEDNGGGIVATLFEGRAGIRKWSGNELYTELDLAQYDKIKGKNIMSDFIPMVVPVEFLYTSKNGDNGEIYFTITGIKGDPVIQF